MLVDILKGFSLIEILLTPVDYNKTLAWEPRDITVNGEGLGLELSQQKVNWKDCYLGCNGLVSLFQLNLINVFFFFFFPF